MIIIHYNYFILIYFNLVKIFLSVLIIQNIIVYNFLREFKKLRVNEFNFMKVTKIVETILWRLR